jgi:hypothetical protein
MTKVYRIQNDVTDYQYFLTESDDDALRLTMGCKPLLDTWIPPDVFIYEPLHKRGDLFNFNSSSLILSSRATEALRPFLQAAGELLEVPYEGQSFWLLNVLQCVDCLDEARTGWREFEGIRLAPERYVFDPDRLPTSRLFKIPQTRRAEVLILDREDGKGFVDALVEHHIEGYELELLWTDS